jgi:hypothetical protein
MLRACIWVQPCKSVFVKKVIADSASVSLEARWPKTEAVVGATECRRLFNTTGEKIQGDVIAFVTAEMFVNPLN